MIHADCLEWLDRRDSDSIHAVVTDPPFGKEYSEEQQQRLATVCGGECGTNGVWGFYGNDSGGPDSDRIPLPRFTVLTDQEKQGIAEFFGDWARKLIRVIVPGGHVFVASNPLLAYIIFPEIARAGFDVRGQIVRTVSTFRGGDRPKNAEKEFLGVTVMPRGNHEPWGLFRKPCEGTVADNLRKWGTGGLRRVSEASPFGDIIQSGRTPKAERAIANHMSLKPQELLRRLCYASLPLGNGIILDTFAGSGSTLAAASAVGYTSIGVELREEYVEMSKEAIPKLASISTAADELCCQAHLVPPPLAIICQYD